jgi:hypothetical protein
VGSNKERLSSIEMPLYGECERGCYRLLPGWYSSTAALLRAARESGWHVNDADLVIVCPHCVGPTPGFEAATAFLYERLNEAELLADEQQWHEIAETRVLLGKYLHLLAQPPADDHLMTFLHLNTEIGQRVRDLVVDHPNFPKDWAWLLGIPS